MIEVRESAILGNKVEVAVRSYPDLATSPLDVRHAEIERRRPRKVTV